MSTPSTSETTVPISCELRDKLRVAKAEDGVTYDEYLREQLALE